MIGCLHARRALRGQLHKLADNYRGMLMPTFFLRMAALGCAFLAIVFISMPILMLGHGSSPVRDVLASIYFVTLGILAIRCTRWLWRTKRFWMEQSSLREVTTLGVSIITWPLMSFMEQRTTGNAKDLVHVIDILVLLSVYLSIKRRAHSSEPVTG